MEVGYECCGGLDGHAKTVVACLMTKGRKEIRTCAPMPDELLQLGDGLSSVGCTHVAIESTGVGKCSATPAWFALSASFLPLSGRVD